MKRNILLFLCAFLATLGVCAGVFMLLKHQANKQADEAAAQASVAVPEPKPVPAPAPTPAEQPEPAPAPAPTTPEPAPADQPEPAPTPEPAPADQPEPALPRRLPSRSPRNFNCARHPATPSMAPR